MNVDFGNLVKRHIGRKPSILQEHLATASNLRPAVVSAMLKGNKLTGPGARERVRSLIRALWKLEVLDTVAEANELMQSARMSELNPNDPTEQDLVRAITSWKNGGAKLAQLPPFIAGPPIIYPQRFFGRHVILKRLMYILSRLPLSNAAIYGDRKIGRTSLLMCLESISDASEDMLRPDQRSLHLPDRIPVEWIYADFRTPPIQAKQKFLVFLLGELGITSQTDAEVSRHVHPSY